MERRDALLLVAAAVALGCGAEVPAGGVRAPGAAQAKLSRRISPNEALPADLDVVVRVDLARLKEVLGPSPEETLAGKLGADPAHQAALRGARAVTLGLRVADLETGDHVLVVEGDLKAYQPDRAVFAERPSANDQVKIFTRTAPAGRSGAEVIVRLSDQAVAFASPAEADSLLRVLSDGADEHRGQPAAEGLLSLDVRPRRLSVDLERRFTHVARLVSQVSRIRGVAEVDADALAVRVEITAKSGPAAERVARFAEALREGADPKGASAALAALEIEPLGAVVHLKVRVPAAVVMAALKDT